MRIQVGAAVATIACALLVAGCSSTSHDDSSGTKTTTVNQPTIEFTETGAAAPSPAGGASKFWDDFKTNFVDTARWGPTVTGAETRSGNMVVSAQIDRDTESATGANICRAAANLLSSGDCGTYSYVIVEDGAGVVVTQSRVAMGGPGCGGSVYN